MRPVLAVAMLTCCLASFGEGVSARAQEPRRFPDLLTIMQQEIPPGTEFQLPIQASPVRNSSPVVPTIQRSSADYFGTWSSGVDPAIQPVSAVRVERSTSMSAVHFQQDVEAAQFVEPAPLAKPIPRPQPLQTAATFPLPAPGVMEDLSVEIPSLPPAPQSQAPALISAPPVMTERMAAGEMIAPPLFPDQSTASAGSTTQVIAPPVEIMQNPSSYLGDIGADPFVQEACAVPTSGWNGNFCGQPGAGDHPCPTTDPNGAFEPYVSGEFRLGNRRVIGGGGFFIPLIQDNDSLLFTDLRGRGDDHGAADGFFGLGYRQYLDPNWIFGAYVYYDLRVSHDANYFSQASVGFELISLNWEFRLNGYFPGSDGRSAGSFGGHSNGTLITHNFVERAYRGLDWEIGHRCLYWGWNDKYEVRWFLGSYYFDHSADGFPTFGGPRGRLEMRINDLGVLGNQSRFEFGLEASGDRIRETQVFGYARIQIPFGGENGIRSYLDPLRRRMLDTPVRIIN